MLAINVPQDSWYSLRFGFVGLNSIDNPNESDEHVDSTTGQDSISEKQSVSDDESVKETHSLLREVHKSIFAEQVGILVLLWYLYITFSHFFGLLTSCLTC